MALIWRQYLLMPYTQRVGGTHPKWDCISEAPAGDSKGSWYRSELLLRVCLSIFSGGVLKARRSNHMCLYVTYTGLFTADGVGFWLLDLPPCPESFPKPLSILGICQLLPDQEWIVQHHKCLLPKPGSDGYQSPISGARGRLENVGFHYCSKFALIRAFKYRNTDYLSPSQLPKNMLYLLYRFAGSQVPR